MLSTIIVPFQVLVVPLFIEVKAFGWENWYSGLLIPGMIRLAFMMRQYASDLPDELLEAARVDGAKVRIFLQSLCRFAAGAGKPRHHRFHLVVGRVLGPLVIVQDKALNCCRWG